MMLLHVFLYILSSAIIACKFVLQFWIKILTFDITQIILIKDKTVKNNMKFMKVNVKFWKQMETIFRGVRRNSNNATPPWRPTRATAMNSRSVILRTGMRPRKIAIPKEGLWWRSMTGRNRTFSCLHWRPFRSTGQAYGWVTMIWHTKEPLHGSQVILF